MANTTNLNLAEALLSNFSNPNFLPCPKVSLYIDPEILGYCGICQTTQLILRSQQEDGITDSTIAIIPCGHLACYGCLTKWIRAKPECPFCRFSLTYELCRHPQELVRTITKETLFSLPETIPMGGKIPEQCRECRITTNKQVNERILENLAVGFKRLQGEYRMATDEAGEQAKTTIENKIQTMQLHFQFITENLSDETTAALASQW